MGAPAQIEPGAPACLPTGVVWPDAIAWSEVAVAGGTVPIAMAGSGPPLLLLHGWTLDARMWLPQAVDLARDFRLIMPDRRGFGRSSAPPDLAQEADDVAAIADLLGLDRFALLGHSQGAAVALDYAQSHGARLTGLIVAGAPLPGLVPRDEAIPLDHYEAWARRGELDQLRAHWSQHPLMRPEDPAAGALIAAILTDYEARDLRAPSVLKRAGRAALAHLEVPVLAMAGESDSAWRRACARALADTAPRASHALIAGAGHLANLDNPQEFNRIVRDFLLNCAGNSR